MIKIHSKFSDYYDSAIGSFPDSEVVFNRTPKIETYRLSEFPSLGDDFDGNIYSKEAYIKNCDPNHELGTFYPRCSEVFSFWIGLAGKWYSFTTLSDTIGALVWSRYAKEVLDDPMKHWKALLWKTFSGKKIVDKKRPVWYDRTPANKKGPVDLIHFF
jgi:hypothetical protein